MRFTTFTLLSCLSFANAFPYFTQVSQQSEPQGQVCDIYTVIESPCVVETWVESSTIIWVEQCATSFNITNWPTYLATTVFTTTTLGSYITTLTSTIPLPPLQSTLVGPGPVTSPEEVSKTTVSPSSSVGTASLVESKRSVTTILPLNQVTTSPSQIVPTTQAVLATSHHGTVASHSAPANQSTSTTSTSSSSTSQFATSSSSSSLLHPTTSTLPSSILNSITILPPSSTTSCIPSSRTNYPDPNFIPANTTYHLQLSYPPSTPLYLTRNSTTTTSPSSAIRVFFYDGLLFALDEEFGVGWYSTSSPVGTYPFALQQYVQGSSDIARSFGNDDGMGLVWEDCEFGRGGRAVWRYVEGEGRVDVKFDDAIGLAFGVYEVTLVLVVAGG